MAVGAAAWRTVSRARCTHGYLEYDRRSQGDFSLVFMGEHLRWTKLDDTEVGEMQGQMEEVSMRKVIASELVSLDGVMESPEQ